MASIILFGRKYKIETSAAKVIAAQNNNLKLFLSATNFLFQFYAILNDL